MDYNFIIGLTLLAVVGFFAYQWMVKHPAPRPSTKAPPPALPSPPPPPPDTETFEGQQQGQQYPHIPGQTHAEAVTPDPFQRRDVQQHQMPVNTMGNPPAQFQSNLRHPEQMFQPGSGQNSSQMGVDVASGRASMSSSPMGGHQQGFSPELAQNGGLLLGNSVYAFDGMEPTGFTAF
jgi:hypothetical protein